MFLRLKEDSHLFQSCLAQNGLPFEVRETHLLKKSLAVIDSLNL
jgi:hypothetical protein